MADHEWLDRYIDAWIDHVPAGGPLGGDQLATLLPFYADDVVYEDVPSGAIFEGHEGVATMCTTIFALSSDLRLDVGLRAIDGTTFAFETVGSGTNTGSVGGIPATGKPISLRSTSVGTINSEGLVTGHRDYWDLAGLLGQLGVMG